MKPDLYDLQPTYEAEIVPLLDQILAICTRSRMPMVVSFAVFGGVDSWSNQTSWLAVPGREVAEYDSFRLLLTEDDREPDTDTSIEPEDTSNLDVRTCSVEEDASPQEVAVISVWEDAPVVPSQATEMQDPFIPPPQKRWRP